MIVTLALLVLGVTAVLQFYFYLRFLRHAAGVIVKNPELASTRRDDEVAAVPVSVVICARNEARNLDRNLRSVLEQRYHFADSGTAFEVIVVNDASADDTAAVLQQLALAYRNLRVVAIDPAEPRTLPGKKFALSRGLHAARHEVVICTDADCVPASNLWLQHMAAPFLSGKDIVAGYGGYRKTRGWLNAFIRYETLHTFFLYYTFWKGGAPYMAVGRNLAARKQVFADAARHPVWAALPSGDDDLLIQLCATATNMAVITDPHSFTWSDAKEKADEYLAQKRRHMSTGKFYNTRSKRLLSGYAAWRFLRTLQPAVILGGLLAVYGGNAPGYLTAAFPWLAGFALLAALLWLCLAVSRITTAGRLTRFSAAMNQRTTVTGWSAFFLCWILYNAVLAPWILWKTKQRWK